MQTYELSDAEFHCWLAGFIDGEGSIGIYKSNHEGYSVLRIHLTIVNSDRDVLEYIRRRFGVNKTVLQRSSNGTGLLAKKPVYEWHVASATARRIIEAVSPYLQVKRRQAELALKFPRQRQFHINGGPRGRRIPDLETKAIQEQMSKEIKALNHVP